MDNKKKIAVLLNGSIFYDSRVKKTIETFSKKAEIDLFYINRNQQDITLFNNNVRLFSFEQKQGYKLKLIRHSFFYNEFNFFINIALSKRINYDIIYCNDLPTLKAGVVLKKKLEAKLIYDSHEIFIGTLNQIYSDNLPLLKKISMKIIVGFMRFVGNIAERRMIKFVDEFITTSYSFKGYFENKFHISDVKIVMNCPRIDSSKEKMDFRKLFSLKDSDFIILFQGVLNKGRALDKLINAMQFTNSNIKLVIIGEGVLKHELTQRVLQLKLKNILFQGFVPASELHIYTKGADVGINLQEPINISKKLASANKLFEYSHAGLPIIASDVPENRRVIEKYKQGVLIQNTVEEIAKSINLLSKVDLKIYQENSLKAALEYNWKNQENILLEITK